MKDLGGAFFLAIGFYALGRLFAKALLPTIFGVAIHQFAYMIIFVALVAALGIVPENIRAAAKKLQSFFTANLILIIMVGVGVDTNIIELAKAITPGNVVIALAIVIGAIIGSALVASSPSTLQLLLVCVWQTAAVPETWQYLVPVIVWV